MIDASSSSTNYETILQHILSQPYSTNFFITLHPSFSSSIRFMSNTFITTSSQQFHHNLWATISSQLYHKIFQQTMIQFYITTSYHKTSSQLMKQFMNNTFTTISSQHFILHYNNEWPIVQHKHFNNASWFFIINLHDNKWVTFFDKHLMIYTQILFAKFHSTIKWQTFIQQLSDKLSFNN